MYRKLADLDLDSRDGMSVCPDPRLTIFSWLSRLARSIPAEITLHLCLQSQINWLTVAFKVITSSCRTVRFQLQLYSQLMRAC
jgi:hypothetical protein